MSVSLISAAPNVAQAAPAPARVTAASAKATPAALKVSKSLKKRVKANSSRSSVPVTAKNKQAAKAYAKMLLSRKYSSQKKAAKQYTCIAKVFSYESGWKWTARSGTGYFGIPQTKNNMAKYELKRQNWRKHYEPQIRFGFAYMTKKYDNPCGAWKHIQSVGWY